MVSSGKAGRHRGCIALGCVIRGETTHYDIVAQESAAALHQLAVQHAVPIGFGILTCEAANKPGGAQAVMGATRAATRRKPASPCAARTTLLFGEPALAAMAKRRYQPPRLVPQRRAPRRVQALYQMDMTGIDLHRVIAEFRPIAGPGDRRRPLRRCGAGILP